MIVRFQRKLTIKEVALYCGVGVGTVSRVINNEKAVRNETRKRVKKAIKQLDYVPNPNARRLKQTNSTVRTIGIYMYGKESAFFLPVVKAVGKLLKKKEYTMIYYFEEDQEKLLEHAQQMDQESQIAGLLLLGGNYDGKSLEIIKNMNIPVSIVFASIVPIKETVFFTQVAIDDEEAIQHTLNHLYEKGHRQIAFIHEGDQNETFLRRLEGYKSFLKKKKLDFNEALVAGKMANMEGGKEAMRDILDGKSPFTAVCCASDLLAIGAIKELHHRGLMVPENISATGFGDTIEGKFYNPSLTTVHENSAEMGQLAVENLLSILEHPERDHKTILMDTQLIVRESVGRPPAHA